MKETRRKQPTEITSRDGFNQDCDSQLVQLLGGDDDGVLARQGHEAAVVVPERVLHAGHLQHSSAWQKYKII